MKLNLHWLGGERKGKKRGGEKQWNLNLFVTTAKLVTKTSSVQLLSHVPLFATPWTAAHQASLSITNSWILLKLMSIESVMPSNHLILYCPLFLLPSIFPSIRVFSNESVFHIRQPKYWSFSFNISPSNAYSGLISFRMDWLDLLAVDLGMIQALLEEITINPTIKPPNLTQDLEIDSWRTQTKPCVHQDPGERSSDPTRDWPRLACEYPRSLWQRRGVSGGHLQGWRHWV